MTEKVKYLYRKYENIILYIIFGGFTTIVSWGSHLAMITLFKASTPVATTVSWILSVTFAFITNKKYVFKSQTDTMKDFMAQMISFYSARLASLGVELVIMLLCADIFSEFFCSLFGVDDITNEMIFKVLANVVILIINYALSKLVIFRNKNTKTAE
jgi:putative flippase GtrA